MASDLTNQAIVAAMRRSLAGLPQKAAQARLAPCSGFTIDFFAVTYPNNELIVTAEVSGVPAGVTLVGATVAAAPSSTSPTIHCMGVASNNQGLPLPVSVLGASTSPQFPTAANVTGMLILAYTAGGAMQQCVVTGQFSVGG